MAGSWSGVSRGSPGFIMTQSLYNQTCTRCPLYRGVRIIEVENV